MAEDADHLNDEHRDTVTFVARFAGDWPDVREAAITAVDQAGVVFGVVLTDGSPASRRVEFSSSPVGLDAVRTSLDSLLAVARERAPESVPPTSLESEIAAVADLTTFQTAVADVAALDTDTTGAYFFGAGESREMTAIRKHLRQGRGLPREQVQMVAYWRRA